MPWRTMNRRRGVLMLSGLVLLAMTATAQDQRDSRSVDDEAPATEVARPSPLQNVWPVSMFGDADMTEFELVPVMSQAVQTWIALLIVLMLLVQVAPWRTWRNLDALAVGALCVFLLLRDPVAGRWRAGHPDEIWVYLVLVAVALYWVLRGVVVVARGAGRGLDVNLSRGALLIVTLGAVLLGFDAQLRSGTTLAARDGMYGALTMLNEGHLPYGAHDGHDGRSPLLYLTYYPLVAASPDCQPDDPAMAPLTPADFAYAHTAPASDAWRTTVRVTHLALLALLALGVWVLGARLHSGRMAAMLVVLVLVFPGASRHFADPTVLIPATLIAWGLALATIPAIGGLLGTVLLVAAGLAWPWAWLGVPVMVAYFLRQGWQALGTIVGLLAGLAGIVAMLFYTVAPAAPLTPGAREVAGYETPYVARIDDRQHVVIERATASETPEAELAPKRWLWQGLLAGEALTLADADHDFRLPSGTDAGAVAFLDVRVSPETRPAVNAAYRAAFEDGAGPWARLAASTRTLLEATWLQPSSTRGPSAGTWHVWAAVTDGEQVIDWTRRGVKVFVGIMVVALAYVALRRRAPRYLLFGGVTTVLLLGLLASTSGGATDWGIIFPAILGLIAATGERPVVPPKPAGRQAVAPPPPDTAHPLDHSPPAPQPDLPPLSLVDEPAPRISVEEQQK